MDIVPALREYVSNRFQIPGEPLGEHGRALIVNLEDSSLVVKTLASHGKWQRYLWAREFFESNGVNVPREKLPPLPLPDQGLYLVFEEYIPGIPLSQMKTLPHDLALRVSEAIKTLHFFKGNKWGLPFKGLRKKGYFKRHLRKIEEWSTGDSRLQREISRTVWVKKIVKKLEKETREYEVIHGDLHGKNIILAKDKIYFIDLVRSCFGSYVKDLVRMDVWERRTWGTRMIFNAYLKGIDDPLLEEKLKLFFLGEFVRRRDVEWVRDLLWRLLEKEELP